MNDLLTAAPTATPFGAEIGVLTSLNDFASRPARGFADGEEFSIGSRRMKWLYTPHVPHGWDCGILFDLSTKTLFCGDLFTQPGANMPPVTESEVLTTSEGMRGMMDYYAHATSTSAILERLADLHRCSPVNMGALTVATAPRCSANWPPPSKKGTANCPQTNCRHPLTGRADAD